MDGIKCINLVTEIQGVENSSLAVPVNDASKCSMSLLAADT